MLQRAREPHAALVFGAGILTDVTRLIKWKAAERDLPPNRFSIRSFRDRVATCLYRAGVDLEYVRHFGRWESSTSAIYVHFDDKIIWNLSICLMRSGRLTTHLKVCTGGTHRAVFGKEGGGWMETMPSGHRKTMGGFVGAPTTSGMENRTVAVDGRQTATGRRRRWKRKS